MIKRGELVIVSLGIQLGRDASERTLAEIAQAEVVFCLANEFMTCYLHSLRPDIRSLHGFYGEHKDRRLTYREMQQEIFSALEQGNRVCAVFYGNAAVFADVPHTAIRRAREAGYHAELLPGVSAADCLYADLGLDPGKRGMQSFEATQFLLYQRQIDTSALLILWQVGVVGDASCKEFSTTAQRVQILVDKLLRDYPSEHQVVIYEAATLAIKPPRIDYVALQQLADIPLSQISTLVVPPVGRAEPDAQVLKQLGISEQQFSELAAGLAS